jgi:hypothetical protein
VSLFLTMRGIGGSDSGPLDAEGEWRSTLPAHAAAPLVRLMKPPRRLAMALVDLALGWTNGRRWRGDAVWR